MLVLGETSPGGGIFRTFQGNLSAGFVDFGQASVPDMESFAVAVRWVNESAGPEVFMLGGKLSLSGGINVGDAALLATTDVHVDIAVLGVCGIDPAFGLSADDLHESQLKLAMTRASARTIALASREKIGRRARYRAVAPEYLDCLITDADASAVTDFNQDGMEIIHA